VRFEPEKTLVLVRCYPTEMMMPQIIGWFVQHGLPVEHIHWYTKRFITAATNSAIRDIALPSRAEQIVFIDADMKPDRRTDPFLTADGDVVGATFPVDDMAIWSDPHVAHAGLMRCDRRVLEQMEQPWMDRVFTADGCEVVKCPCLYFSDKARALGFTIRRAGWCGHTTRRQPEGD